MRTYQLGVDLVDVDGVWASRYDIGPDGAVLVRPDGYVAWRSESHSDDLAEVLGRLLNRQ